MTNRKPRSNPATTSPMKIDTNVFHASYPQFNTYKYNELAIALTPVVHDLPRFQKQLALETIRECCWTGDRRILSDFWCQQHREPSIPTNCFSLLQYNIQYFYSNQCDLVDMVHINSPTVISLNELGTGIPDKIIKQLLFSYNVFKKEGTNPHGGAVLAIDKNLKCELIDLDQPNIVAARVIIDGQLFVLASIYSPPTEALPLAIMSTLLLISKRIIFAGDLNAKHSDWGCSQSNKKGHQLASWLEQHNMNVVNAGIQTSLRSITTIDLVISNIAADLTECRSLAYSSSDHLPIFTEFSHLNVTVGCRPIPRTYWKVFTAILSVTQKELDLEREAAVTDASKTFNWFITLQQFLNALRLRVTVWHTTNRKRPSISLSLRILLRHKHYLQNRYRHTQTEEDRLRLRSWNTLVKSEFQSYRQHNWNSFILQVASPNPATFWRTVKSLNKKKTVNFAAITDHKTVHRTSEDIVNCLQKHFTDRYTQPIMSMNNALDKEATELWQMYETADEDDIKLVCYQSDLSFDTSDIENTIRSLKNKNSSGFDHVSNKMVKLLPSSYHVTLAHAYSELFRGAHWGPDWKQARTICFNKSDNPAPTTNQIRPISLLPIFSKIYERLFLLRFNKWAIRMNILPPQQSGARPNQATTSRVNCVLEQITQSLRSNTFTPVVYIDFLQAFDLLWHQGFLLKLNRLSCPPAYMCWIVNYFKHRTLKIDYDGLESELIKVERSTPQGSCFGPIAYVIGHHDLPEIFETPSHSHAYVDDIAIVYAPSIHLKFRDQITDIEKRINDDMKSLMMYARDGHQPINPKKTEIVVYHRTIRCPKLTIYYDGVKIEQKKVSKYLGFLLDERLSFCKMIDAQFIKLRKAYQILKTIHRQFPTFFALKAKFFNTYAWPHLNMLATIYCMFSRTSQERVAGFYRRCLRLIYCLFRCPTIDLHCQFGLPTLEERYRKCLQKRLKSIQQHESLFIDCVLQNKLLFNILHKHYREKARIRRMPEGRPNKRITSFLDNSCLTFFDELCQFALN